MKTLLWPCMALLGAVLSPARGEPAAGGALFFNEVTREMGVDFRHVEGTTLWHLPQVTGPGVALMDFDGDGFPDIFFVQGSGPGDGPPGDLDAPPAPGSGEIPGCALYRNCGRYFEECSIPSGSHVRVYGMGVAAFDNDSDGYTDIAIAQFQGPIKLLRNMGDGTFRDESRSSGIGARPLPWGSSVTPLDYDRDGFLDLYVGQYLLFRKEDWTTTPTFKDEGKGLNPITLLPGRYPALPKVLFHNRGDGTFEDRTAVAGVADPGGQTMGALAADLDGDGWTDLMTANDGHTRCQVFLNLGGGTFRNVSAGSFADEARGSMGFAVGDVQGTGAVDVYVTHWMNQPSLYRVSSRPGKSGRKLVFLDQAQQRGLAGEIPFSGWAAAFMDVDNDSFEDLLQIAGHTGPPPDDPRSGRLDQHPTYLFKNLGTGSFRRVRGSKAGDPAVDRQRVGRSAAFGDLDLDGVTDAALNNNNQTAEVWRAVAAKHAWIGLLPVGTRSNRTGIGVKLEVFRGGIHRQKEMASGESYFASSAHQVLFGLGEGEGESRVRARWPSGLQEEFVDLAARRYHRLVEGTGHAVPGSP